MQTRSLTNRLRRRAVVLRQQRSQGGFTLLELLVVVAILAAVAGTATIALQDTDARAAAAAHVAMMDELNKGLLTYEALNFGAFPDRFDSMLQLDNTGTDTTSAGAEAIGTGVAGDDVVAIDGADRVAFAMTQDIVDAMDAVGITQLRYIDTSLNAAGVAAQDDPDYDCANLQQTFLSRNNAVVAGNMFLSPDANGCGVSVALDSDGAGTAAAPILWTWTGGNERITGNDADPDWDGTLAGSANSEVFVMLGIGPSSSLFDRTGTGALTTVPIYRHVSNIEYNRFIALFHVADINGAGDAINVADQVVLVGIVDGAGDTKEEELGEWDGTRNTI